MPGNHSEIKVSASLKKTYFQDTTLWNGDPLERIRNVKVEVNPLKQLQAEAAAELDAMLPSILDKAFKGQLA